MGRRVEEYSQLLARAFNGAITVNGLRIVAHPSGTLIVRGNERHAEPPIARGSEQAIAATVLRAPDLDNDWSQV